MVAIVPNVGRGAEEGVRKGLGTFDAWCRRGVQWRSTVKRLGKKVLTKSRNWPLQRQSGVGRGWVVEGRNQSTKRRLRKKESGELLSHPSVEKGRSCVTNIGRLWEERRQKSRFSILGGKTGALAGGQISLACLGN